MREHINKPQPPEPPKPPQQRTINEDIRVDFSSVRKIFDDLINKHNEKESTMSDGITDALRDSEPPKVLDPKALAERMRLLRRMVIEYNQIRCDLEANGYNVKETANGLKIWKEISI